MVSRSHGNQDIKIKTLNMAKKMDRDERGELTVDQFATFVRNNSSTRKRRQPRQPIPQRPQQQQLIVNYMPPQHGYLPQDPEGLL